MQLQTEFLEKNIFASRIWLLMRLLHKTDAAEQGGIFVDEEPSGCSCGPVADFEVDAAALQTKAFQPYLEIKAPLNGYVTNMNVNVGKYFNVGEPVCDVIDKQALMLQLTAYEKRSG